MKILIVSKELPPDIGGAGTVAYNNAFYLSQMGHEVVVLTAKSLNAQRVYSSDFQVIEVDNNRLWFIPFYKELKRHSNFDAVVFNDPHSVYVAGLFSIANDMKNFFCYFHGSEPELIYKKQTILKRIFLFKYFYHKAMLKSNKIIAVSHFMKDKIIRHKIFKKNINKKIIVNYAGIDFKNRNLFNFKLNNKDETIKILSVGRIIKEKGYDKVAEILGLLSFEVNFHWTIVGDGDFLSELKTICGELNISHKVSFCGNVVRSDLHKYYSNADLFVVLSRLQESFSLAHLEAQAFGVPAVGLNHSGMKECVIDKKTGFLLNSEDELIDVLKLESFNLIDQKDCIAQSDNFSLEKMVKNLEKTLLESIY